jgi:hypothetical protein
MATPKRVPKESVKDRAIAFRAPSQIHGALKQITGMLEMKEICIDGRIPYERDVLMWLVGELYMEGPEKWGERLARSSEKFKELMDAK